MDTLHRADRRQPHRRLRPLRSRPGREQGRRAARWPPSTWPWPSRCAPTSATTPGRCAGSAPAEARRESRMTRRLRAPLAGRQLRCRRAPALRRRAARPRRRRLRRPRRRARRARGAGRGRARPACGWASSPTTPPARPSEVAEHLTELGVPAGGRRRDHQLPGGRDRGGRAARRRRRACCPVGGPGVAAALTAAGLAVVDRAEDDPVAVVQGYGREVGWAAARRGGRRRPQRRPARRHQHRRDHPVPARARSRATARWSASSAPSPARQPLVTGKPDPAMHAECVRRTGARRPLVVGDRLDTDIEGARRAGRGQPAGPHRRDRPPRRCWRRRPDHRPDLLSADAGGLLTRAPGRSTADGRRLAVRRAGRPARPRRTTSSSSRRTRPTGPTATAWTGCGRSASRTGPGTRTTARPPGSSPRGDARRPRPSAGWGLVPDGAEPEDQSILRSRSRSRRPASSLTRPLAQAVAKFSCAVGQREQVVAGHRQPDVGLRAPPGRPARTFRSRTAPGAQPARARPGRGRSAGRTGCGPARRPPGWPRWSPRMPFEGRHALVHRRHAGAPPSAGSSSGAGPRDGYRPGSRWPVPVRRPAGNLASGT